MRASIIFAVITLSGVAYYLVNNAYSFWAFNACGDFFCLMSKLVVYYFLTQPIYLWVMWLMHDKWGGKGFLCAILLTVSSDLLSLPHSFPSVFHGGETTLLPSDLNIAPYPDWQLARFFSPSGIITFETAILVGIIIPTLLNVAVYLMLKPKAYEELVKHV